MNSEIRNSLHAVASGWYRFWFTPSDPLPLAYIRIIVGIVLLYTHCTTYFLLADFIGPNAWFDAQAKAELAALAATKLEPTAAIAWLYKFSIWDFNPSVTAIWFGQALFLLAILAFTLGLWTRLSACLVWLGHLSYIQRSVVIFYGMDAALAVLTLYLLFSPAGERLSVDALRKAKRAETFPETRISSTVILRLIQVHFCLIYAASGIAKLQGGSWWNGSAVLSSMLISETARFDLSWLGAVPTLALILSNVACFFTILTELAFPVLVWQPRLRPYLIFCAIALQAGIAFFLCIFSFQLCMFAGILSFVPAEIFKRMAKSIGRLRHAVEIG